MEQNLTDLFIEIGERNDWPEYYEELEILRSRIECYTLKLINEYDPESVWNFQLSILNWLQNVNTVEEKFLLINSLSFFTFTNRAQRNALYKAALYGPIIKWLIENENYNILDPDINKKIDYDLDHTCISAGTDSADIKGFCHINHRTNKYLPTWSEYINENDSEEEVLRQIEKCKKNMKDREYNQIVVIEDFIGSGKQIKKIINFLSLFRDIKILLVPLIICPQGDIAISQYLIERGFFNISYSPVSVLPWDLVLANKRPNGCDGLHQLLIDLKTFAENIHENIVGKQSSDAPGYLGYGEIGALFAQYTNCPNSTLPLFYFKGDNWNPLFPRIERMGNKHGK